MKSDTFKAPFFNILALNKGSQLVLNRFKKQFSKEEALRKAQKFCAYRERCVHEMSSKLKDWGQDQSAIDEIIDELVESNFINEERFLKSYIRGKFTNNKWGKVKIKQSLRQKSFSDSEIDRAFKVLDQKEYGKTLRRIVEKKANGMDLEDRKERSKLYYFMLSKGYEAEAVIDAINDVDRDQSK